MFVVVGGVYFATVVVLKVNGSASGTSRYDGLDSIFQALEYEVIRFFETPVPVISEDIEVRV